jgi:hypothetical protein
MRTVHNHTKEKNLFKKRLTEKTFLCYDMRAKKLKQYFITVCSALPEREADTTDRFIG